MKNRDHYWVIVGAERIVQLVCDNKKALNSLSIAGQASRFCAYMVVAPSSPSIRPWSTVMRLKRKKRRRYEVP